MSRSLFLSLGCALALLGFPLRAADSLTLAQALAIALVDNPELKAFTYEVRAAEARALQAGIRPNPELSVALENVLGTGTMSGVKGVETTLQLSDVLDLGGSRVRREAASREETVAVSGDYERKRIEVLAEVALRFTEMAADAARLVAATQARSHAEDTIAEVQRRVEAAALSPIELNKARMTLAHLLIEEEHAEHEWRTCRQSLAAILGRAVPDFESVQADLLALPDVPAFDDLASRLEASPYLARFGVEERWREAQLRLAESLRRAPARVSAGLRRSEATDDFGFVLGVSVPLSVRQQNTGSLREAEARRDQIPLAAESARLELRASLYAVYQELLHARTALTELQKTLLPLAEDIVTQTRHAYREGRDSVVDLLDAQRVLLNLRREEVALAATHHLHVITIERLLGAPLNRR